MAISTLIHCVVVTPESAVLDQEVDFVAIPMIDGELGVMPGRAPLIGRLGFGELRTKKGVKEQRLYIDGGFVEIQENVVTVLTQKALEESELSVEKGKAMLEEAKERAPTPEGQEEQLKKQAKARAQIRMAKKK